MGLLKKLLGIDSFFSIKSIKKLLGFDSPYSWMKWLRIPFAVAALLLVIVFFISFGSFFTEAGIIGFIFAAILFIILFGPTLLAMIGIAALLGLIIGGIQSGVKQLKSFKETAATSSTELMEVEKLRMKSQLLDFLFFISAVVFLVLWVVLAEFLLDNLGDVGFYGYGVLAAVMLLVFWVLKNPVKKRYKNAYKEIVVKKDLESIFENMDFKPDRKLEEPIVQSAALFGKFSVYNGNDYIAADYHGHHFIQSDIHLFNEKEETYIDKNGNMQTRIVAVNVFKGRLMVFDYDAISNEPVAVYDKKSETLKGAGTIQTELDLFNKMFSITASNPTDAFRILTPPVLEGIALAREKLSYPLHLSFKDDKLFVAFENGDAFEAGDGDITLSEQRKNVSNEIRTMLDLIDTLYLKN